MADILIRGMEMPPKGKSICIEIFGAGGVHKFGECYPCALAYEVKTPHGRLIDADALDEAFTALRFADDWKIVHWGDRKNWCLHGSEIEKLIDNAPTIVPAEGGTDE